MLNKRILQSLKSYMKAGELPLMLGLLPYFLSKEKVSMELFRSRLNYSMYKKIKKRYVGKKVKDYTQKVKRPLKNPIWFMWLQGIDSAPILVQKNFSYLRKNFGEQLIEINSENLSKYIDLPDFILKKKQENKITNTHFSDLVRIQLLATYGGTWIDSTVLVEKKYFRELPDIVIPRTLKPGKDGNIIPISSWFLKFPANNPLIVRTRNLLFNYWEKNNQLIDYFLLHYYIVIASKELDGYIEDLPPIDNSLPHYLMLEMRKRPLDVDEIKNKMKYSRLIKLTNKTISAYENDNYSRLISILETWS